MTIEEAIYCMKSYLPEGEEHCEKCRYYGKQSVGNNVYVCNSAEAHRMAIKALEKEQEHDS